MSTSSDQRAMLEGFLDWFRGVAEHKLDGLTREQSTEVRMPSGTTMLGVIQHLSWAERLWFPHYFLGGPHEAAEVDESFVITPDGTVESVLAQYRDACAESRRITAAAPSLDAPAAVPHRHYGEVTLGWIIVHLIEETARHCGHLDILRELTDGATGD